jgi:hypothetical protein
MILWNAIKSAARQWYVTAVGFLLLSAWEALTHLNVPVTWKYYVIFAAALSLAKLCDKAVREWIIRHWPSR